MNESDIAAHIAGEAEWRKSVDEKLGKILSALETSDGRVRALEDWRNRQSGMVAAIAGAATITGGVLMTLAHEVVDWMRAK